MTWRLIPVMVALGGCECGDRLRDAGSEATAEATTSAAPTTIATAPAVPPLPPARGDVAPKCRTICRIAGRCTLHPESKECIADRDDDCRRSRACVVNGMCTARGGLCLGTSDEDCRRSTRCAEEGLCALAGGATMTATNCVAKTDADCAGSKTCIEQNRCKAIRDRCDDPDNPIKGPPPDATAPPPP